MISKKVIKEIDYIIKHTWINNIKQDYNSRLLLKEDSLKCSLYYHLRRKLSRILKENNLRIYPEYYISETRSRADLAIVQIDPDSDETYLKNSITDIIAVFELKYAGGNSEKTVQWVKNDIQKIKNYIQSGHIDCYYYFAAIYENECYSLSFTDKRSTNNWAFGYLTELNAGYIDGKMEFQVNSYNELNKKSFPCAN